MTLPSSVDVAIVGGGAAGLAAARRLADEPLSVVLLEARDRLGGRAHTVQLEGWPQDLGCGWLHSADRNALADLAEPLGFTLDRTPPPWDGQSGDQGFPREDQAAFRAAYEAFDQRVAEAAKAPADQAAAELFDPGARWNPLIDAVSTFYNGTDYAHVSVKDYARYLDTDVNWRMREGYGKLIADLAPDTPTALNCEVLQIDHGGADGVRLITTLGELTARVVIVTLPTDVLTDERLRFTPPLPDKLEAAAAIPLGCADKCLLALDEPHLFPADGQLFGRTDTTETAGYHLRPFGRPLIEAFFGGAHAAALEADSPGAFAAFATDELVALVGSKLRRKLRPLAETRWNRDPFARGAYSFARVGQSHQRAALAAPVNDRLFFAGEACSPRFFSTAHGAYETGVEAAEGVLKNLLP